ncbi:MAG: peptidoglycan DD-metalloendopeptidase family protein [Candidatus Mcinerneyibacterium aminivorans]|uniref:Peptidoglycan DD-metalloendopeptidase family protein n=1 Tax=Candidatus Mcinerneyibacterium aminivorans TaxID=2703815 RepID=A0A5D0MFN5_9BACT|nr:MAG: peptidoglycan DD-metalloendopeptidase family protein [Candidatus Mcinerneyibacterium aminivorans]
MKKIVFLLIILFSFSGILQADIQNEIDKKEKELKQIEVEIKRSRQQKSHLAEREGKILNYLENLRDNISSVKRRENRYKKRLDNVNQELENLLKEIGQLDNRLEDLKNVLEKVVEDSFINYKKSESSELMPNLGIKSRRSEILLQIFGQYNYILLKEAENVHDDLKNKIDRKKKIKKQIRLNYLNLKISEKKLVHLEKVREKSLNEIRNKKEYYQNLIAELKNRKNELNGLINKMERRAQKYYSDINFKSLKGELIWPVEGSIFENYGKVINKKYNTEIFNEGIDIQTDYGARVNSVANGLVVFSKKYKSFGNMIMIDHGNDYFSIYTNLSSLEVKKGQRVSAGHVIGKVGNDLINGKPILHFEIRHKQSSLSPLSWLK